VRKQPHLDRRAIHPFYGSHTHYIILLLLSLALLYSAFAGLKGLIHIAKSHVVNATVHYNVTSLAWSGEGNRPFLSFTDARYGDQRYIVYDPDLLSLIQHHPELSSFVIRYSMEKSGAIYHLQLNNFWSVWGEIIAFSLLIIALMLLIIQLSPGPAWYWKHVDRRLKLLSKDYYQVEVKVKQLENIDTVFTTGQRVCRLYADIYIHTQNLFVEIKSAKFLVEPEFRMSYPHLDVYVNLKNPSRYEADLKKFLKQNASTLHGYTEDDREYAHSNSHKVG
jgi:hypothetical protein